MALLLLDLPAHYLAGLRVLPVGLWGKIGQIMASCLQDVGQRTETDCVVGEQKNL